MISSLFNKESYHVYPDRAPEDLLEITLEAARKLKEYFEGTVHLELIDVSEYRETFAKAMGCMGGDAADKLMFYCKVIECSDSELHQAADVVASEIEIELQRRRMRGISTDMD